MTKVILFWEKRIILQKKIGFYNKKLSFLPFFLRFRLLELKNTIFFCIFAPRYLSLKKISMKLKTNIVMKKVAILILLICFPMLLLAQSEEAKPYVYNILTFSGSLKKEGFKVDVDNGKEIEKLKDANGKTIKFKTPAAALMYFISQGWELYVNGATSEGAMVNGIGASETTSYWIIRRPCTQEEFDKTVEEGIRK